MYIDELHRCLPPLHVEGLGSVPTLGQLAGDGVEGARSLVQLVDGVECQGFSSIGDQLGVRLNK